MSNCVGLELQLLSLCSSEVVSAHRGFACVLLALLALTTEHELENPKLCHIPTTFFPMEGNSLLGEKRITMGKLKILRVLFLERDFGKLYGSSGSSRNRDL